ncbi:MAG: radical SAM protein [Alphaproteobacteria bacterium]|uniref:Radical SAM protein n=1 Tax=Candidatus Nitrobium versatile TaxID=2884831 RepID=A0A953JE46_9BACT|nr:radical SAM protein [Candidatus Nitrobium versatile]
MSIHNDQEFFVQWHLTERCNLRCSHCYQTGNRHEELSLPEIEAVIGEIADTLEEWSSAYGISFSSSFSLTGGEPFLRTDFPAIIEKVTLRGFAVFLLSNGTLIDRERAGMLASFGVKGVQVSMEGPREVHEGIRGRGSFNAAVRGIRHLVGAGVPVTLNTTLSSLNADTFMEMMDLAVSLGVRKLGFSRLVPSGRGLDLRDRMLSAEKVKEVYSRIFAAKPEGLTLVTGDPVAWQMRHTGESRSDSQNEEVIPTGGCAAGLSGFTLLADGTVVPCRRLPLPLGTVREDSLREIWAASPVLEALRDKSRYGGKCGTCARWSHCRGCRAIAYACSQARGGDDFLAEDPQCFIGQENSRGQENS